MSENNMDSTSTTNAASVPESADDEQLEFFVDKMEIRTKFSTGVKEFEEGEKELHFKVPERTIIGSVHSKYIHLVIENPMHHNQYAKPLPKHSSEKKEGEKLRRWSRKFRNLWVDAQAVTEEYSGVHPESQVEQTPIGAEQAPPIEPEQLSTSQVESTSQAELPTSQVEAEAENLSTPRVEANVPTTQIKAEDSPRLETEATFQAEQPSTPNGEADQFSTPPETATDQFYTPQKEAEQTQNGPEQASQNEAEQLPSSEIKAEEDSASEDEPWCTRLHRSTKARPEKTHKPRSKKIQKLGMGVLKEMPPPHMFFHDIWQPEPEPVDDDVEDDSEIEADQLPSPETEAQQLSNPETERSSTPQVETDQVPTPENEASPPKRPHESTVDRPEKIRKLGDLKPIPAHGTSSNQTQNPIVPSTWSMMWRASTRAQMIAEQRQLEGDGGDDTA